MSEPGPNRMLLVVFVACLFEPSGAAARQPDTIETITDYYKLTSEEARTGLPVRLKVVVLYSDASWQNLWVYDGRDRLYLRLPRDATYPAARREVLISGRTALSNGRVTIDEIKVTELGAAELPAPRMLTTDVINGQADRGARVSMAGTVMNVSVADGHLRLTVAFLHRHQIKVTIGKFRVADAMNLLGAHVGIVGCAADYNGGDPAEPTIAQTQIYVPGMEDVTIYERGPPRLFEAILRTTDDASLELSGLRDPRLVVLRGQVEKLTSPNRFVLSDKAGSIPVSLRRPAKLVVGDSVEVCGFFCKDQSGTPFFAFGKSRVMQEPPWDSTQREADPAANDLPVLRTTQSVRALSVAQAGQSLPVELNGIVTYCDPGWRVIFIEDLTGGIYLNSKERAFFLSPGERVRVRGTTDPGGYAAMVEVASLQRLGNEELPKPRRVPVPRLFSGAEDSQWITMLAHVQQAQRSQNNLVLTLRCSAGEFEAVVFGGARQIESRNWAGARVQITGVCGVKANPHRQVQGIYIHIPGLDWIEFLDVLPDDPFDIPVTGLTELLTFPAGENQANTLVRVDGVVTYSGRSGHIALQDETRGVILRVSPDSVPAVGTNVSVIGFPEFRDGGPTLRDVRWRECVGSLSPTALTVPANEDLAPSHHAALVTLQATVVENNALVPQPSLTLERRGVIFRAGLPSVDRIGAKVGRRRSGLASSPAEIEPGALVEVTGVCEFRSDKWSPTRILHLLVARPSDISTIKNAPWWDSRHTLGTIVGLVLVIVACLLWGSTLRARIEEQTNVIRAEMSQIGQLSARYDCLVKNADELIFLLSDSGRITAVNPATERAFGVSKDRLIGQSIWSFLGEESGHFLRTTIATLSTRQPSATIELHTQSDTPRTLEIGVLLRTTDAGVQELQCIARDVTDRRELENQNRHMQKMDSIGQLAAGIAHDYNNLMTVVLGHCEILNCNGQLADGDAQSVEQIHTAADRAASLTQQLLAFSRRQIMSIGAVDGAQLIEELSGMFCRLIGENIEIVFDMPPGLPLAKADRSMLEQIILNLVVNGRDAMSGGGTLTIAVEHANLTTEDTRRRADALPGSYLRFTVSDTGTGIAPEHLPNIFEPFFTTKAPEKGTGLGLSTVFGIARQHQGWVEVVSKVGVGSTFHVFIPVVAGSESRRGSTESDALEHVIGGAETILIVEDDESVRRTMVAGLTSAGYTVIECVDGPSALDQWRTNKDRVDLLITDMIMPGGLSGQDVAREVRRLSPSQRIIFCSGYSFELTTPAVQSHLDRVLPKPFERQMLIRLVREVLDHAARTRLSV